MKKKKRKEFKGLIFKADGRVIPPKGADVIIVKLEPGQNSFTIQYEVANNGNNTKNI